MRDLQQNWDFDVTGKRILIFGAGGAAQGIIAPLLDANPDVVLIANRTTAKADALAHHFGSLGNVETTRFNDIRGGHEAYDLIINATSAGLDGEQAPFPRAAITERHTVCYDLSYSLSTTPFVRWAKTMDAAKTRSGWGMLIEQAAESFRIWRGVMPDTHEVIKRLPVT
ncbi:MAG: NAD(P)-dependent oxidoreductase, partial [Pseudomonadota bacterium]